MAADGPSHGAIRMLLDPTLRKFGPISSRSPDKNGVKRCFGHPSRIESTASVHARRCGGAKNGAVACRGPGMDPV